MLKKVREQNSQIVFTEEAERRAVLESLGVSTEDFDWATVVNFFYGGFHSELAANLTTVKERHRIGNLDNNPKPWKAVGDELIYQFVVQSRQELHWITVAFLAALRSIDRKVLARGGAERGLRVKGSAWVAGFPVRNRIIRLPAIETEDFLGPDIDTGFRIGKCTQPGMLVVSVELCELLSEAIADVNPVVGKIVGWEELKGVWNDKRYPVIWVDHPSGYPRADGDLKAHEFDPWQQVECSWCQTWESADPPKQPLREFVEKLRQIRRNLPKALGLVDPYIIGDPDHDDKIPDEHAKILDLLDLVQKHQVDVQKQDADISVTGNEQQPQQSTPDIDQLFEPGLSSDPGNS